MFEGARVFSQRNDVTQVTEWYFQAREGLSGPYECRKDAENALSTFVAYCRERGCVGGRASQTESGLMLEPMEPNAGPFIFEPLRRKKGIDSLN